MILIYHKFSWNEWGYKAWGALKNLLSDGGFGINAKK